jgi:uncharacterized protein YbaP (TraB family)
MVNRLRTLIYAALLLVLPAVVHAACSGADLRETLSAADRQWIAARVAETPYPAGNHWIATKDGRTLHLIGTLHLNDPRMAEKVDQLTPVIAGSDAVLFEVTQDDMRAFQSGAGADMSAFLITSGPTLLELMEPDDWEALAARARAAGVPSWMAAKMRPWFLATFLGLPPCIRNQKQEARNGMDKRLDDLAADHGIPRVSLEDTGETLALFNKGPMEEQVRQLSASIAMLGGNDDQMTTTLALYFGESHAEIMAFGELVYRQQTTLPEAEKERIWKDFTGTFLAQRNKNWMPAILTHPGQRLTVAVGAGHLAGEFGLLRLLEREGYVLKRGAW